MDVAAKGPLGLSMLDHLAQDVEVVGHFLLREEAHELEAVAQLDLRDDGQRAVAAERIEVVFHRDPQPLLGTIDVGQQLFERVQVVPRVLAEDRDQQVFLAVEIEVDRAVGYARRFRDLRDLGVEVAELGEHIDGGAKDALALGSPAERFSLSSGRHRE
jgi:hypothetical protein